MMPELIGKVFQEGFCCNPLCLNAFFVYLCVFVSVSSATETMRIFGLNHRIVVLGVQGVAAVETLVLRSFTDRSCRVSAM
jgi:hypothetical protein